MKPQASSWLVRTLSVNHVPAVCCSASRCFTALVMAQPKPDTQCRYSTSQTHRRKPWDVSKAVCCSHKEGTAHTMTMVVLLAPAAGSRSYCHPWTLHRFCIHLLSGSLKRRTTLPPQRWSETLRTKVQETRPGGQTLSPINIKNGFLYFTNNQGNNVKKAFDDLKALTSAVEIASIC